MSKSKKGRTNKEPELEETEETEAEETEEVEEVEEVEETNSNEELKTAAQKEMRRVQMPKGVTSVTIEGASYNVDKDGVVVLHYTRAALLVASYGGVVLKD